MQDRNYTVIVLVAALATWAFAPALGVIPTSVIVALDAAGVALAAVARTEKALDHGIEGLTAIFIAAVVGVGAGTLREVVFNHVPPILSVDFYATAALAAGFVVVVSRSLGMSLRTGAIAAGMFCFLQRMAGFTFGWQLPRAFEG